MALGMPKSQREQTMVFVALLGLIAVGAYYYFSFGPRSTVLAAKEAYLDTLEERNALVKVQSGGAATAELKAQIESYGANLQLMKQLVPASNEVPALLDSVSTAARRVGLDIGKVEPMGPESGPNFDAHRYRFTVTGGYHGIAEFITRVGSLPRIMVPVNLQLNAINQVNPLRPDLNKVLTTVFELHTYTVRAPQ